MQKQQNKTARRAPIHLQPFFCAKTIFKIIHCAAAPFAFEVFAAIKNTENVFGKVCHHTEYCGDPHPENCAGTADCNCTGNAGDVAGTDRCGKSGAKGLELGDVALIGFIGYVLIGKKRTYCFLNPMFKINELETFCNGGADNACSEKNYDAYFNPDKVVNNAVDFSYFCKKFFHNFFSFFLKKNKTAKIPKKDGIFAA